MKTSTRIAPPRAALVATLSFGLGALASPARAAEPAPRSLGGEHFTIDPIADGAIVAGGLTFDLLLGQVLSTGEITPQAPGNPDRLLSIDRVAVTQTVDPNADGRSTIALYFAFGYAALDSVLSGVRDGTRAGLVDAILYTESFAITSAFTWATKIGVRRPRPVDYANCWPNSTGASCSSTDLQLSFFSGHASEAGALTATASYLAFARAGWRSPRPWITLGVGTTLTAFVSYERVRSGKHFPTDVIMGSLAGAGIGLLVPHLHHRAHPRDEEIEAPAVVVGYAPAPGGGGVSALWRF